ncbi:hypothetical protein [Haloferax volcanii]|uniref:Uncharacterized protein n=1 Tax=Haloferax volcanii TaxID=2246 RepID=A0A847TSA1_HALVO|nr:MULTISPECIES: hypothetical protein [Haloferax]NLV03516.1 hypothetical protein [Haloferax alexandrinus]
MDPLESPRGRRLPRTGAVLGLRPAVLTGPGFALARGPFQSHPVDCSVVVAG